MNATQTFEVTSKVNALAVGYVTTIRGTLVWRTSDTHYAAGETLSIFGAQMRLYTADEVVNFIIKADA